jgi:hypothetical protein
MVKTTKRRGRNNRNKNKTLKKGGKRKTFSKKTQKRRLKRTGGSAPESLEIKGVTKIINPRPKPSLKAAANLVKAGVKFGQKIGLKDIPLDEQKDTFESLTTKQEEAIKEMGEAIQKCVNLGFNSSELAREASLELWRGNEKVEHWFDLNEQNKRDAILLEEEDKNNGWFMYREPNAGLRYAIPDPEDPSEAYVYTLSQFKNLYGKKAAPDGDLKHAGHNSYRSQGYEKQKQTMMQELYSYFRVGGPMSQEKEDSRAQKNRHAAYLAAQGRTSNM